MTAEKLLVFLVMLSVLVVLHEYGHFLMARRNGVRVTDFAMGFGPTLLRWTSPRSGTVYRLNLLPLGGYCQMKGEDGKSSEAEQQREFTAQRIYDPDNFQAKGPLRRLSIVVAGPIANFLVSLALLFFGALAFGIPGPVPTTVVGRLVAGYPAQQAGLRPGDRITTVDGTSMADGRQLVTLIHGSAGKRLRVTYVRDGRPRTIAITPRLTAGPDGKKVGLLGFEPLSASRRIGVVEAATNAGETFAGWFTATLGALGGLFTHPAQVAGQVSGPIGIARATVQVEALGPYPFLSLAALLSLSLGIFNLLPIPALDGGRAAFIIVEMLRGRPVDPEKEALVHVGGFAVLILLMIAVSFHDVTTALSGKGAL